MRHRAVVAAALLITTAVVSAQTLTIGKLPAVGLLTIGEANAITFIDISHPAARNGTINGFAIRWKEAPSGPCAGAYNAKILRPGTTYGTWTIVSNLVNGAASNITTLSLGTPLAVRSGDVIAVTQLKPVAQCGGMYLTTDDEAETTLFFNGDIQSGVAPTGVSIARGNVLNAIAFENEETAFATLPVVGSVAGNNNSFFRTSITFTNPDSSRTDTRITFHPAGKSASAGDPTTVIPLLAGQSAFYPDIVSTLGASGLGSLDLLAISGKPPIVTARIFNDNGAAGTQGLGEELITRDKIMRSPRYGFLPFPGDPANFRMNLGVRSFDAGATVSFSTYAPNGTFRGHVSKNYDPNFFEQFSANTLGATDGWINVYVTAGSAIVYASYTDNRTNDSNIRYASSP